MKAESKDTEISRLKKRLRTTAQILIDEIGADGPKNAEDSAMEAVAEIARLKNALSIEESDREAAAGECLVSAPQPGTDAAKLLITNKLARGEIDRLSKEMEEHKAVRRSSSNVASFHDMYKQARVERDKYRSALEGVQEMYMDIETSEMYDDMDAPLLTVNELKEIVEPVLSSEPPGEEELVDHESWIQKIMTAAFEDGRLVGRLDRYYSLVRTLGDLYDRLVQLRKLIGGTASWEAMKIMRSLIGEQCPRCGEIKCVCEEEIGCTR